MTTPATTDRIIELKPIPASAQAVEEKLRAIREQTTMQARLEAYRQLTGAA